MVDVLAHRGPDDSGLYHSELGLLDDSERRRSNAISTNGSERGAILGHRRLSIIDLSGGRQPISNEDSSVWIVLNGEIYNYR